MRTIKNYQLINSVLKRLYIKHVNFTKSSEDLRLILAEHPKLVIALNHGPMMGALAGLIGIADAMNQSGAEHRMPFAITWRHGYNIPLAKKVLTFITQVDHGLNFDEAAKLLEEQDFTDCIVMPEGELCNFGDGLTVQAFLSPRFIELAITQKVPILIAVHQGSESWAWPIKLNTRFNSLLRWLPKSMKAGLQQSRTVSIPKLFKKRINTLQMSFSLYHPKLKLSHLSQDKTIRHAQLAEEAEIIRLKMNKMITLALTERRLDSLVNA